nr:MFS transporter [Candidatus Microthrix sp.]
MNGSRVLGPLLAALVSSLGTGWIFMINAGTYVFVIAAVGAAKVAFAPPTDGAVGPWARFREGLDTAREDPVLRRVLGIVSLFSLCSLVFIYQLPGLAENQLGITGSAFYRLFAAFGLGAAAAPSCWALCWADGRCTGCRSSPCPPSRSRSQRLHSPTTRWPPTSLSLRSASSTSPW